MLLCPLYQAYPSAETSDRRDYPEKVTLDG